MRGTWVLLLGLFCLTATGACRRGSEKLDDLNFNLRFARTPPAVGDMPLTLTLADAQGQPVRGAEIRIEGNMNHAGMVPVFASLHEADPGQYSGVLKFTMPGDWFVLVTARLADGLTIERKIDVPGVTAS